MPDVGAYIALVEKVTGRLPDVIVGKPYAPMAEFTADFCGVSYDKMAFVGDRLYTDIKFAVNNGQLCKERYERYLEEYNELVQAEKNKY